MKQDLITQYQKSLLMLRDAIEACPETFWDDDRYANRYWRIVYHTLFYTDLYLSPDQNSFAAWSGHLHGYNFLGGINFLNNSPITITAVYTRAEMLEYAEQLINSAARRVTDNLTHPSGFDWQPMSKCGLHVYNIRHLQNHIGQLVERLRSADVNAVKWR